MIAVDPTPPVRGDDALEAISDPGERLWIAICALSAGWAHQTEETKRFWSDCAARFAALSPPAPAAGDEAVREALEPFAYVMRLAGRARGFPDGTEVHCYAVRGKGELTDAVSHGRLNVGNFNRASDIYAALSRVPTQPEARDGWVLVPREPTQEMVDAAVADYHAQPARLLDVQQADAYRAMIAAAPEPRPSRLDAIQEGDARPIRYVRPVGANLEEWRENVRKTDLYQRGDTVLVWVNEGDLYLGAMEPAASPNQERADRG